MYRSASAGRFSDEFSVNLTPAAKVLPTLRASDVDELPVFSQFSKVNKKHSGLHKKLPAENAIHLIPVILILCGFILWINSYPISKV